MLMATIAQWIGSPPTRTQPGFSRPRGPTVESNTPDLGSRRGSLTIFAWPLSLVRANLVFVGICYKHLEYMTSDERRESVIY